MKKFVMKAALGLAALLVVGSSSPAFATTYDFSYAFAGDGSGQTATGSFTGTGPINDITDIGNITLSLDGAAPVAAYNWSYTPTSPNCGLASCYSMGGAVVSGDSSLSNFVFSTASDRASLPSSTYFYVIQPWSNSGPGSLTEAAQGAFGGSPNSYINAYNGQFVPANFSVTAVPEPATWALMFMGVGMAGGALRMTRKRRLGLAFAA